MYDFSIFIAALVTPLLNNFLALSKIINHTINYNVFAILSKNEIILDFKLKNFILKFVKFFYG